MKHPRIHGPEVDIDALIAAVDAREGYPNTTTKTNTWATKVLADDGDFEVPDKLPHGCEHMAAHLGRRARKEKEHPMPPDNPAPPAPRIEPP